MEASDDEQIEEEIDEEFEHQEDARSFEDSGNFFTTNPLKRKLPFMDQPQDLKRPKLPGRSQLDFWKNGFAEYLETGQFADVTLVDERGKRFKCHKVLLVRKSEYFRTLFLGGFREREQPEINVSDPDQVLDQILKFLYTGSVNVNRENVTSLLNAAEVFVIESLSNYVIDNVQIQFESNKDLVFAYYNHGDQSRLAITDFIKNDFESMVHSKCFAKLSAKTFGPKPMYEILSDNELNISEEDVVSDVLFDYIELNREFLSNEEISLLLSAIRYAFVSTAAAMKIYGKYGSLCPQELLDSMVAKACANDGLPTPAGLKLQRPRGAFSNFNARPKGPNDSRGLFHWMGRGKASIGNKWKNPLEHKLCAVTSSSNWNGTPIPFDVVGTGLTTPPATGLFWADHGQNQWIAFDVNPGNVNGFLFKPTHYAYGYSTSSWMPRNWVFEASVTPQGPWVCLKTHNADQTFVGASVCVFEVDPCDTAYRLFRIRITGVDSSGSDWLGLSSFDLFGETVPI